MIPTGLVMKLPSKVYFEEHTTGAQLWWKDIVRDFRVLAEDEVLPPGVKSGVSFETISVNPGVYLLWLKSELEQRGVDFVRHRLGSLDEVRSVVGDSAAVINATGLGARSLVGVQDDRMFPIRGQTIVAIAPKAVEFVTVISATKTSNPIYLIPRPAPPGMVLVGGTFQENNWDTSIHKDTAQAIWQRANVFVPALADPGTRIVSHNVGLRPARAGGPRVEAEYIDMPIKDELAPRLAETEDVLGIRKQLVVHSYGFGPAGYQQSWGAAAEVVAILRKELDGQR
ncbi:hypothetical protein EWM64_g2013 [Hericium alpestre]|uniref:FAD dependent oxidoreductase domain-containing protein n=1 Tax=Hericium alpestre TaxID=135208 RepID=A0A4Z0A7U6_9AGAM|nr:hypothetical protein EWM64_g2013 [Hericium alpestre]